VERLVFEAAAAVAANLRRGFPVRYAGPMQHACPICRKPTNSETNSDFPFCSERCRLIDLGNWASEKYKVSEPVIDESVPEDPGEFEERSGE
jgi:uncharacterized protein